MRQALIFSLLSCTLISASPAVAKERVARQPPYDWVLVDGDHNNMSGSMDLLKRAQAQRQDGAPLLYVQRGGRAWVIRDAAVLARARAVWAPQQELGKKMEALGSKMSAIGDVQRQIGDKMSLIGTKMGKIGIALGSMPPDDPDRGKLQDAMNRLQQEMRPLEVEMNKQTEAMRPFSDEMSRHGKEMEAMTERAQEELAQIVDDALARGLGREVR